MSLPSHVDDGAAKSCWRWRIRGNVGRVAMSLLSHANDCVAESCWRWRIRGNVGHGAMSLLSRVGDGVAEATLAVAQCCCRVMLAMVLLRRRWP
jgi:hypothetical protein